MRNINSISQSTIRPFGMPLPHPGANLDAEERFLRQAADHADFERRSRQLEDDRRCLRYWLACGLPVF